MPWLPLKSRVWRGAWFLSRHLLKKTTLSPEGLEAWNNFYTQDNEHDQLPLSLEDFAKLLFRYGPPDIGNPWPQGQEEHYLIHPGGFISGEIEHSISPFEEDVDPDDEEAQIRLSLLIARRQAAWDRLGLLLHYRSPLISAVQYWAKEDIQFACAMALLEGRWEVFGGYAPDAIVFALRKHLIEPMTAPGLLIGRRLKEDAWYPAPWAKPEPVIPEKIEEPAPTLKLSQWREQRESAKHNASPSELSSDFDPKAILDELAQWSSQADLSSDLSHDPEDRLKQLHQLGDSMGATNATRAAGTPTSSLFPDQAQFEHPLAKDFKADRSAPIPHVAFLSVEDYEAQQREKKAQALAQSQQTHASEKEQDQALTLSEPHSDVTKVSDSSSMHITTMTLSAPEPISLASLENSCCDAALQKPLDETKNKDNDKSS